VQANNPSLSPGLAPSSLLDSAYPSAISSANSRTRSSTRSSTHSIHIPFNHTSSRPPHRPQRAYEVVILLTDHREHNQLPPLQRYTYSPFFFPTPLLSQPQQQLRDILHPAILPLSNFSHRQSATFHLIPFQQQQQPQPQQQQQLPIPAPTPLPPPPASAVARTTPRSPIAPHCPPASTLLRLFPVLIIIKSQRKV
jgi:hypothetical protein